MKYFLIALTISLLFSCKKWNYKEKGAVDIISNIYFDASKGLENRKTFHVSRLNFQQKEIFEIIPDLDFPEINKDSFYIIDTLCYQIGNPDTSKSFNIPLIQNETKPISVYQKTSGTIFTNDTVPGYSHRVNRTDTILFNKNYKRFDIKIGKGFTRYYVFPTDTIIPYSMNKIIDKEYNGRLERIDSYNPQNDVFVTVQLILRDNWDSEASEFFDYNNYLSQQKN